MATLKLRTLLRDAVRAATGVHSAQPRDGQMALARDIESTVDNDSPDHLIAVAPTGTGKSLAYLVPAAMMAAQGSRTLVSTQSLGLQHQIVEKDAPAVGKALFAATGKQLKVSVFKGWSNYVCLAAASAAANEARQQRGEQVSPIPTGDPVETRTALAQLGDESDDPVLKWALSPNIGSGDISEYPDPVKSSEWEKATTTPDACLKARCPLQDVCFPTEARREAASADIVVTNHSMLAVQAAKAVPVVIGSATLGTFDQVVVDEAHTLPGIVRDMGAVEVSARRISSVSRQLGRLMGEQVDDVITMQTAATQIGQRLTQEVEAGARKAGGHEERVPEGADPLEDTGELIGSWLKQASRYISRVAAGWDGDNLIKSRRLTSRMQSFSQDVDGMRVSEIGFARWYEMPSEAGPSGHVPGPSLRMSPVDVSGMLGSQVWSAPVEPEDDEAPVSYSDEPYDPDDDPSGEDSKPEPRRYALPVVTVSATMPKAFGRDAGLRGRPKHYDSPFAVAYGGSRLFVPKYDVDGDVAPTRSFGKRTSLDTAAHPEWALRRMRNLVEASGGRALVLSATTRAGHAYAAGLRRHAAGRWQVFSQWDGLGKQAITQMWKSDETSVLVATRSFMTGVDAPGASCSLVVIDRVPRGAGNVVDDARVEVLVDGGMSQFRAREEIYAVDAAQLLEQAAGRLIRSTEDRGMVAVLDPRMLKPNAVSYSEATRKTYLAALAAFTKRTNRERHACDWLVELVSERHNDAERLNKGAA